MPTHAPQALGKALRGLPREQIVVSTKVGRYGPEAFDFSGPRVTASVHESLARLQLDYIDIIQCHDIEFGDLDQVAAAALTHSHSHSLSLALALPLALALALALPCRALRQLRPLARHAPKRRLECAGMWHAGARPRAVCAN